MNSATEISEINGKIAWLFEKIKKVETQIQLYRNKDEFMTMQFETQKSNFLNELNTFLSSNHYELEVKSV